MYLYQSAATFFPVDRRLETLQFPIRCGKKNPEEKSYSSVYENSERFNFVSCMIEDCIFFVAPYQEHLFLEDDKLQHCHRHSH